MPRHLRPPIAAAAVTLVVLALAGCDDGPDRQIAKEGRADDMPRDCWIQSGLRVVVDGQQEGDSLGTPPAVAVVTAVTATGMDRTSVVADTDLAELAASISEEPRDLDLPRHSRGSVTLDLADGRVTGWHASVADIITALDELDAHSPALPRLEEVSADTDILTVELTEPGRDVDISRPPDDEIALLAMDSTDPHMAECFGS